MIGGFGGEGGPVGPTLGPFLGPILDPRIDGFLPVLWGAPGRDPGPCFCLVSSPRTASHARTHALQTQTQNTISRLGVAALFSPQTSEGYDVLDIHAMVIEILPLPYNNNMLIMHMNVCIVN